MAKKDLRHYRTTVGKALDINEDAAIYGTFAEIGAGQEVARFFFQAGHASQTIAKTMSAYDMAFSDEIYGKETNGRYVCESRLNKMLDKEYKLLERRLDSTRGERTQFFSYANTVTTGDQAKRYCHGWMGIRFQTKPKGKPNDIILHVRMLDKYRLQQQETLGVLGVNLIAAAFRSVKNQADLLPALTENIKDGQIAVDLIRCVGPDLGHINNQLLNIELVRKGLAEATLFGPDGEIVSVSDTIYGKPVLIERADFKSKVETHKPLIERGLEQFGSDFKASKPLVLLELTMRPPESGKSTDDEGFYKRVKEMLSLKKHILVSNFTLFYKMKRFLRASTKEPVGILLRATHLNGLFDEKYYKDLEGGLLEGLGKLLDDGGRTKIYVFPVQKGKDCLTAAGFAPPEKLQPVLQFFQKQDLISDLSGCDPL